MKRFIPLLLFVASIGMAQTIMTVDDVAVYALEHSREIEAAVESLEDAREALEFTFGLEDTSLTIGGGYSYVPDSPSGPSTFGIDGSVSVPIISEVSLTASLNDTFGDTINPSGSFGVRYSPFAGTSTDWKDSETFRKAEISLENLYNSVSMDAEEAALDLVRGQLNLQAAESSMELEEQTYEIAKKRFDLSDITFSELEDARSSLSSARRNYYDSQKALLSLKKGLFQLIGPDLGDISVHEVTADDVLLMVASREEELEELSDSIPSSVALLNRVVELEALTRQLDETPVFEPNLSVSANVNYNSFRAGASVSITLSPSQIQTEQRDKISGSIEDKKLDLELEQATLELELRMLQQSISVAREALDISLNDYDNTVVSNKETEYLATLGERTAIEVAESALSLFTSRIHLFASATDLYKNLGDLLLLYRNG